MQRKTRQNQLNRLYNQDIAPEDSEITSFYYHKTLAFESFVAIFSLSSIIINLYELLSKPSDTQTSHILYDISLVLTFMGILAMIFERMAKIQWVKQTKLLNSNLKAQIFDLSIKILLFIPSPCTFTSYDFTISTYSFENKQMNVNNLLTFYLLLNRFFYIVKFLVHSELYYGSRPDRLSRLYTVEFGTFNSIKFLINEKPWLVIITTFVFNFIILPLTIMSLQSDINPHLSTFASCLHFVLIGQVTVGYGDLNVLTIFGRFATVFIVLIGITFSSLLLILFVRAMQPSDQEQQSHYLLQALQKKMETTKARVKRIEHQWIYSNMFCPPQQKSKREQQIKAFRYNNRRDIMFQKQNNSNLKRMMLSNFSQIVQSLSQIQEKHSIISKCLQVINSNEKKHNLHLSLQKSPVKIKATDRFKFDDEITDNI